MGELLGRGQRHDVGGVLGTDVEDVQVQLLLGERLDQRQRIGRREQEIELALAGRLGELAPHLAQLERVDH